MSVLNYCCFLGFIGICFSVVLGGGKVKANQKDLLDLVEEEVAEFYNRYQKKMPDIMTVKLDDRGQKSSIASGQSKSNWFQQWGGGFKTGAHDSMKFLRFHIP